jgi:hypothetical protein
VMLIVAVKPGLNERRVEKEAPPAHSLPFSEDFLGVP